MPGHHVHGARYAGTALQRGATAILTDPAGLFLLGEQGLDHVCVLVVPDARGCLPVVAALLYGEPGRDLTVVGITGTNGKTTVAAMIAAGLAEEGVLAATIGTVGVTIAGRVHPVSRTTPAISCPCS
ncbi:MAG: Mur ligase family protein [Actinomycetales bacterium]